MGAFGGLANYFEQKHLENRQDQVIANQRKRDDLERSIQIYQAGGGTNPDGTPMTPEQRQKAIQDAVSQRISLSTPEDGPQLFQKLRDLFHGGKKTPGVIPTDTGERQPWDEKIPGVNVNPQTGVPVAPHTATPASQEPMATHNPQDLVKMAQQGPMSLEQIVSSATPPPQSLHQISDAPKRGSDGKYYMWYANQDGSNPHRVEVPDWSDETSLEGKWREYESTYKALHDGATPPNELKEKWLSIQSGLESKDGKGAAAKPKTGWIQTPQGLANVQLDASNHPIPGTENYDLIPPAYMVPHVRTGMYTFADADGNVHQVPTTSTTQSALPSKKGAAAVSAPSSTPAASNPAPASKPNPSTAATPAATAPDLKNKGEKIIGYKGSDAYKKLNQEKVKATVEVNELNSRAATAEESMDRAKAGDGPAQVALIAAYIKSAVGGGGIRVTQAEWNQATQTAPWLARIGAHFTDDGFFAYSANVLTHDQIDSMVKTIKEKAQASKDKLGEIKKQIQEQKASDTGQTNSGSSTANPDQTKEEIKSLLRQKK